ncbi:filament-like plant protein 7 [Mercurialis annua]|uniref:filament-like plant protein 7 n=1 Tax=Mercurialis annua TaxID=3986 RepID=UPI00215EFC8C|nr:filament-like plant protein 7 [Mercurialis annua]XP_050206453.1 filament-like plant protein 7 [Mercurialis annua]
MDHKSSSWLWRKKSTEKMIVSSDNKLINTNSSSNGVSPKENHDEIRTFFTINAELEKDLKSLNDKLSSVLSECKAKDELLKKQEKMIEEAMAEWEEAEAKAVSLKLDLDEALQHRLAGEERLNQMEAALKECMQQLRFVRDEQEHRIHDAVMKASGEFEKSQMILEESLAETSKRYAKMGAENAQLSKALLAKEKSVEDLTKQRTRLEADLNNRIARLESTDKDNTSLKYEVRVLEKELEIRNEEIEFNRRTGDVSHKQHLESVKKIAKLESECQRLRVLVRKRLPGPAALAKMKSEVDILGRDSVEMRRRRTHSGSNGYIVDSAVDSSADTLSKQINFLTEQLYSMEEENKTLKEAFNKKVTELQTSRSMFSRAASKLSQFDLHFDGLSKSQTSLELSRSGLPPRELSQASMSDVGSDDKISCAESWASNLISELEHFKHGKQRGSVGSSDINLMDDFVEMERLAIVSVDQQSGSPHVSSDDANAPVSPIETRLSREIIPLLKSDQDLKSNEAFGKAPYWLQDILKVVSEQTHLTQRKPDEILEDVRMALAADCADTRESLKQPDAPHSPINNSIPIDSSCAANDDDVSLTDRNVQQLQTELGKSIQKITELVEGMTLPSYRTSEVSSRKDASFFPNKNEASSGYMVRVFQWKTSELSAVLQQFVHACYDLLNGKSDVNRFAQELCAALDWVVNHCFSLQDVSSMRDAVKKHFEWDETRSEGETEVEMTGQSSEVDRLCLHGEQLEGRLQSAISKSETWTNHPQEAEKTMANMQKELDSLKMSKTMIENQMEDLKTHLTEARAELNKACQKISTLEVELEHKNSCCEDLEATCLELQLQLESVAKNETPNYEEEKQLRTDLEITAASEKLAECQETILSLGKQLKAMASPSDAALFDKVISSSPDRNGDSVSTSTMVIAPQNKLMNQRSSLLDRMLAEDNATTKDTSGPTIKESDSIRSAFISDKVIEPLEKILNLNGTTKHEDDNVATKSLAIVPSKKKEGGNLWRKLLWRKKKSKSKKPAFSSDPSCFHGDC